MPQAAPVLPVLGAVGGIIGAIGQQQAASQAAGLSREALELQKKLVDEYTKELEEIKPYRRAMRQLTATRMTWAPHGWPRWTSDPWRLTANLPPIQTMLNPPPPPASQSTPPTSTPPPSTPPHGYNPWDYGREPGAGIDREMGW